MRACVCVRVCVCVCVWCVKSVLGDSLLQVKKKDFQGNQKDVGMVEAEKVSKQGKDCNGHNLYTFTLVKCKGARIMIVYHGYYIATIVRCLSRTSF